MRVTVRRRLSWDSDTSEDCEVDVHVEGGYAPEVMRDLISRAREAFTAVFGDDADSETETQP